MSTTQYVDVNQAIRDEYGLNNGEDEEKTVECPFCNASNQKGHSECRNCGRPLGLKEKLGKEEKQKILGRLAELEE